MMFFTAEKAKKISDRERKRYARRTCRKIRNKIKDEAKQGNTSTTIGYLGYYIGDELRSLLKRKGFTVIDNEWGHVQVSWDKDMTETKD